MFDTSCSFIGAARPDGAGDGFPAGYDLILACGTSRRAKSVFGFIPHARRTALIVGNELKGIEKATLRSAGGIVSIPMSGAGMESLNVGVAAAIALWALTKSKATRGSRRGCRKPGLPDALFVAPEDPSEIGSALRSAWAFGWKRVFLDDPHQVWFGRDRSTVAQGRAAARRYKNPLAILPYGNVRAKAYGQACVLTYDRSAPPLSRTTFTEGKDAVLILPDTHAASDAAMQTADRVARKTMRFHLDCPGDAALAPYRLAASIVLAEAASQHDRGRPR